MGGLSAGFSTAKLSRAILPASHRMTVGLVETRLPYFTDFR
jgi:hypothetical protein